MVFAHLSKWLRQGWLSATKTHCESLSAVSERRRIQEPVSVPSFVIHTVGETRASPRISLGSQKERPFLGSRLNMCMPSSDATQVDKLAVQWQCNQKASLMAPVSGEIVQLGVAYGEIWASGSVSLALGSVLADLIRDERKGSRASLFTPFFVITEARFVWFVCLTVC